MRGWIEWFAKGLWKRRRPIQVMIAITAVFTLLVLWQNRDVRPARTMQDPKFEKAANALCAEKIPPLRAVRREEKSEDDLEKETAAAIDKAATKLEGVVAELRTLEVQPKNQSTVAAWLAEFDGYIAAGRHYANALRAGDPEEYTQVDDEAVAPLKAISHFARANYLDACIP
jgi:Asp-tRNA(Asn)/Glu-tRNA(Gln) amidotransferase A subunit family amidase